MCAAERREPQAYGTIIVVGGGCYGSYYVRQLERATRANAIAAERIVVVDRDSNSAVNRSLIAGAVQTSRSFPLIHLTVSDWRNFFAEYLAEASEHPYPHARDAIVPSPLMPHLMGEWITNRTRARFPDKSIAVEPFHRLPHVPWDRAGADGTHYVSFATWMCPVNCIEPRICPHTRDTRTWSMPEALAEYAAATEGSGGAPVIATMFCRHRAYGVGMFDTSEVIDAEARVAAAASQGDAEVIIGTVSHCHGALTRLVISSPTATRGSHVV